MRPVCASDVELNLKARIGHYHQFIYTSATIKFEKEGAVAVNSVNFRKDASEMRIKRFWF